MYQMGERSPTKELERSRRGKRYNRGGSQRRDRKVTDSMNRQHDKVEAEGLQNREVAITR